jgi:Tfp pilus assembly protein PilF
MRRALDAFAGDPRNRYANHALQMAIAAELLAGAKRVDEGLQVVELAAARFPDSLDVHLVRAFVAERAGDLPLASSSARRALAIDPNNRQARSLLERVDEKLRAGS